MKMIRIIAVLAGLLLAFSAAAETVPTATEAPIIPAEVGFACPDFELTLLDGEAFRLSEQRGKVVFINLWATWCPPCVMEMPEIEELSQTYPDELVVLGVSLDQEEETVRDFLAENGYTYNFAMDDGGLIGWTIFPTYSIPNSVFIDPEGVVTSIEVGATPYQILEQRFLDALAHAQEDEAGDD